MTGKDASVTPGGPREPSRPPPHAPPEGTPKTGQAHRSGGQGGLTREGRRFEQLVGDITAAVLDAAPTELDRQFGRALQWIGEHLAIDRVTIAQFSDDSEQFRLTHVWTASEGNSTPRPILSAFLPWYMEHVRRRDTFVISSLDELPDEAVFERHYAQRLGLNSIVTVPLVAGGPVLGALVCSSLQEGRTWPEETIRRLRLLGALFASALTRKRATDKLRQSEEAFRRTFEQSPLGMALVGADFRFLRVNPTLCQMLGYSERELTSLTFLDVTHPEHAEHNLDVSRRLRAGQIPSFQVEKRYLRKDGMVLWANTAVSVIHDAKGNVLHTLAMVEDITERKQALMALAESEQKYRRLFATVSDAILVFDAETLRFVDVNEAAVRLYGYAREHFLTLRQPDITAEPEESRAAIGQTLNGGLTRVPLRYHRKKDGTVFPVEIAASTLTIGGRTFLCGVVRDVTEREQAEHALRESEEKYRSLVAHIPDVVWTSDADGNTSFVAPNVTEVYGYTPEEIYAQRERLWFGSIHPDDGHRVRDAYRALVERGKRFDVEYRIQRKDGEWIWLHDRAMRTYDDRGRVRVDGVFSDITRRKQVEDQLRQAQKMEAVGQLAGGIAHDFRNQLFAIKLCLGSLLRRSLVTSEGREYVDDIARATDRSAELASQLLAFSRKDMLQPKPTNLDVLVEDIGKSLRRIIGEDIRLSIVPAARPCLVNVDPGQFEHAIVNIVTNARDAMPDGGELTIQTALVDLSVPLTKRHPELEPGRHAMLAIRDTGAGMDSRTLERIFEPFFTTKDAAAGSGLGLSMVYEFVKQSGGAIEVESQPGTGSTFRLYFPCGAAVTEPARPDEPGGPLPRGTVTVLVVEDEEAVRRMLAVSLQESGYTALVAANAGEALTLTAQHDGPIHLLIADVVMPGMSGLELADRVRTARPELAILFISGYTGTELSRRGVHEGNADLVIKPFSHEQLLQAVRRTLDAARTTGAES